MTLITRHLACGVLSLCTLHTAWGLSLDPEWSDGGADPRPVPHTHTTDVSTPLSALLLPRVEVSPIPLHDPPFEPDSLLRTSQPTARAFREERSAFHGVREFYLQPDFDVREVHRDDYMDERPPKASPTELSEIPSPRTIPEPESASLLAIGLAGLGLRACWDVRRRGR